MLGLQRAAGDGSPMASAAIIDCQLAVQAGEQAQNTHMPIGMVSSCTLLPLEMPDKTRLCCLSCRLFITGLGRRC